MIADPVGVLMTTQDAGSRDVRRWSKVRDATLLAAILICNVEIAIGGPEGAEPGALQRTLNQAAATANKSLPRMENGIRLERVRSPGMKTLVYEYSYADEVAAKLDVKSLKAQAYSGSLSAVCDRPGQKDWFESGVTTIYLYRDKYRDEVFRVQFTKKDCDQLYRR